MIHIIFLKFAKHSFQKLKYKNIFCEKDAKLSRSLTKPLESGLVSYVPGPPYPSGSGPPLTIYLEE